MPPLGSAPGPRIVVLGSLNIDLVQAVKGFPKPGETLSGGDLHSYPGGKGANQAVAVARLGQAVAMIGQVGADAFAVALLASLSEAGVATDLVRESTRRPVLRPYWWLTMGRIRSSFPGRQRHAQPGDGQIRSGEIQLRQYSAVPARKSLRCR